jgi:RND family efflux transporter MFP subunit
MATRLLALALAVPLFLLALNAGRANYYQPALPKVLVSHPIPREVTDHTVYSGHVEPGESAAVSARAGGEVVSVHFKPGAAVKKGAVLFQLDDRRARAALAKADAEEERAAASVRRAAAELARQKHLAETGQVTKESLEAAAAGHAEAEAVRKSARASVELARLDLESTRVTAPIAGRVGRPAVAAGAVVQPGSRLAVVTSTDQVSVVFDIDEATALRLAQDGKGKRVTEIPAEVELLTVAGHPHKGTADLSHLEFNRGNGAAQVRVTLPNPDGLFLPGLSARVRLIEGKPYKAVMVTPYALQSDAQGHYVLVVGPGNVLERRYVKVGRQQGGLLPVRDGLKATDQVVVDSASPAARRRVDDAAPGVGTAVDPQKVEMPHRAPREAYPWAERGFSPLERGSKGKMKGKVREDP